MFVLPRRSSVCSIALTTALVVALPVEAAIAQTERATALDGIWSQNLDTCSLSDDEDETRITIGGGEISDYVETCQIADSSLRGDGSTIAALQCGQSRRGLRVFPKSPDSAVFYLPENKRPRSRDLIRCPSISSEPVSMAEAPDLDAPWRKVREPRRLIKLWLDARQRCRTPASIGRDEACAERRQIGSQLRALRLCHFTRGAREGWRSC